jgi:hypothetical protein
MDKILETIKSWGTDKVTHLVWASTKIKGREYVFTFSSVLDTPYNTHDNMGDYIDHRSREVDIIEDRMEAANWTLGPHGPELRGCAGEGENYPY